MNGVLGAYWYACHWWLSVDRTHTSRRPSALVAMTGSEVATPPSEKNPVQPEPATVWKACQTAPSVPRANTSSRPSALRPTVGVAFSGKQHLKGCHAPN